MANQVWASLVGGGGGGRVVVLVAVMVHPESRHGRMQQNRRDVLG